MHYRVEGWMAAGVRASEESPDSLKQRCRVTPGRSNPTESATENKPLRGSRRFAFWQNGARVKRWGKSPPGGWQQRPHGKPHREQCQIGILRGQPQGRFSPRDPGWQLERMGNHVPRGMVIQRGKPLGQNPAYKPSAHFKDCLPLRAMAENQQFSAVLPQPDTPTAKVGA